MEKLVFDYVVSLVEKLGYTANSAWPMMVKYTWANGISFIVFGAILMVAGTLATWFSIKLHDDNEYSCWELPLTAGLAGVIIGGAFICANLVSVLAPEGTTIMNMFHSIKK